MTCSQKYCLSAVIHAIDNNQALFNLICKLFKDIKSNKVVSKKKCLDTFYGELKRKNIILCDVGMFYLSSYIFECTFSYLFYEPESEKNTFLNDKMQLYEWIEPRHLDIDFNKLRKMRKSNRNLDFYDVMGASSENMSNISESYNVPVEECPENIAECDLSQDFEDKTQLERSSCIEFDTRKSNYVYPKIKEVPNSTEINAKNIQCNIDDAFRCKDCDFAENLTLSNMKIRDLRKNSHYLADNSDKNDTQKARNSYLDIKEFLSCSSARSQAIVLDPRAQEITDVHKENSFYEKADVCPFPIHNSNATIKNDSTKPFPKVWPLQPDSHTILIENQYDRYQDQKENQECCENTTSKVNEFPFGFKKVETYEVESKKNLVNMLKYISSERIHIANTETLFSRYLDSAPSRCKPFSINCHKRNKAITQGRESTNSKMMNRIISQKILNDVPSLSLNCKSCEPWKTPKITDALQSDSVSNFNEIWLDKTNSIDMASRSLDENINSRNIRCGKDKITFLNNTYISKDKRCKKIREILKIYHKLDKSSDTMRLRVYCCDSKQTVGPKFLARCSEVNCNGKKPFVKRSSNIKNTDDLTKRFSDLQITDDVYKNRHFVRNLYPTVPKLYKNIASVTHEKCNNSTHQYNSSVLDHNVSSQSKPTKKILIENSCLDAEYENSQNHTLKQYFSQNIERTMFTHADKKIRNGTASPENLANSLINDELQIGLELAGFTRTPLKPIKTHETDISSIQSAKLNFDPIKSTICLKKCGFTHSTSSLKDKDPISIPDGINIFRSSADRSNSLADRLQSQNYLKESIVHNKNNRSESDSDRDHAADPNFSIFCASNSQNSISFAHGCTKIIKLPGPVYEMRCYVHNNIQRNTNNHIHYKQSLLSCDHGSHTHLKTSKIKSDEHNKFTISRCTIEDAEMNSIFHESSQQTKGDFYNENHLEPHCNILKRFSHHSKRCNTDIRLHTLNSFEFANAQQGGLHTLHDSIQGSVDYDSFKKSNISLHTDYQILSDVFKSNFCTLTDSKLCKEFDRDCKNNTFATIVSANTQIDSINKLSLREIQKKYSDITTYPENISASGVLTEYVRLKVCKLNLKYIAVPCCICKRKTFNFKKYILNTDLGQKVAVFKKRRKFLVFKFARLCVSCYSQLKKRNIYKIFNFARFYTRSKAENKYLDYLWVNRDSNQKIKFIGKHRTRVKIAAVKSLECIHCVNSSGIKHNSEEKGVLGSKMLNLKINNTSGIDLNVNRALRVSKVDIGVKLIGKECEKRSTVMIPKPKLRSCNENCTYVVSSRAIQPFVKSLPLGTKKDVNEDLVDIQYLAQLAIKFTEIEKTKQPLKKMQIIVEIFESIFLTFPNCTFDEAFPIFIFCVIKSQTKNLRKHASFLEKFRPHMQSICSPNECFHLQGNNSELCCECYLHIPISKYEYYLTTLEACLTFIERLEFKTLSVTREEYDSKILKSLNEMKTVAIDTDSVFSVEKCDEQNVVQRKLQTIRKWWNRF